MTHLQRGACEFEFNREPELVRHLREPFECTPLRIPGAGLGCRQPIGRVEGAGDGNHDLLPVDEVETTLIVAFKAARLYRLLGRGRG